MNPRKKNQLLQRRMILHLHLKLTTSQHLLPTPNLLAAVNQKTNPLQKRSQIQLHHPKSLSQHRARKMTRAVLPRIVHHQHRLLQLMVLLYQLLTRVAVLDHQHRVTAHLVLLNLATSKMNLQACQVVLLLVLSLLYWLV